MSKQEQDQLESFIVGNTELEQLEELIDSIGNIKGVKEIVNYVIVKE